MSGRIVNLLRSRAPVLATALLLLGSALWVWSGTWVFEVRLPAQRGTLRLLVPREVTALELRLLPGVPVSFYLAETPAAAQEFWTYQRPEKVQDLIDCQRPPPAGSAATSCRAAGGDRLVLNLAPTPLEPGRDAVFREVLLVPVMQDDAEGAPSPRTPASVLPVERVVMTMATGAQRASTARGCVHPAPGAAADCRLVDTLLSRPALINLRDPQPRVVALASWAAALAVPALVLAMLVADAALFAVVVLYALRLLAGWGLGREALGQLKLAIPALLHIDQLALGRRRVYEYMEVTGPALGFLLTVGSLLLAFDPAIFNERDTGRFTQSMSLALTATFGGLMMRILAFTADRLLEHLLRLDADASGFVTPPEEPRE